jgi:phosphoglycolate phosphatase
MELKGSPSTLVFDFDGTLHDSMYTYRQAFPSGYQTLVDAGLVRPRSFTREELAGNIGLTAREAWGRLVPEIPWEVASRGAAAVGAAMRRLIADGSGRLFPGTDRMLDALKETGHEMVFLSNCATPYQETARKAFGLDRWMSGFYNAEEFGWIPKERIFETIRQEHAGPYIIIGDRYKDILVAHVHGLPCIGCIYGYGTREELESATYLAGSPEQVVELVALIELRGHEGNS